MSNNDEQLTLNIPGLLPQLNRGRVLPYHLRITAVDDKGNRSRETTQIYVRP